MLKLILLLVSFHQVFSISENNYVTTYNTKVVPYFEKGVIDYFQTNDGIKHRYYQNIKNNKNALIILPGRSEFLEKYKEVAYDLKDLDLDIFIIDLRGQGGSQRLLEDKLKGHVENFKDYAVDLEFFIQKIKKEKLYQQINILGHSMGGGVALVHSIDYPKTIKQLFLIAPMIEIKLQGKNEFLVYLFMTLNKLIGKKEDFIGGKNKKKQKVIFKNNKVTFSKKRYEIDQSLKASNSKFHLGYPTNNWVLEALKLGKYVMKNKEKIQDKQVTLFLAEHDHYSHENRQRKLCMYLNNCTLFHFKDTKHELLKEKDPSRQKIINYLKKNL